MCLHDIVQLALKKTNKNVLHKNRYDPRLAHKLASFPTNAWNLSGVGWWWWGQTDLMEHLNLIATTETEDMTCSHYKPRALIYKQPMKGGALCEQTSGVLFNDSEKGSKKKKKKSETIPASKKL